MNPHSHKVIGAQVSAIAQDSKRLKAINAELLEALKLAEPALWILATQGTADAARRHKIVLDAIAKATE